MNNNRGVFDTDNLKFEIVAPRGFPPSGETALVLVLVLALVYKR